MPIFINFELDVFHKIVKNTTYINGIKKQLSNLYCRNPMCHKRVIAHVCHDCAFAANRLPRSISCEKNIKTLSVFLVYIYYG